jgi:hypothetical protein
MPSSDAFNTYPAAKQAEIITRMTDLFRGNDRAHGLAEIKSFKYLEDKNKWKPEARLVKTKATEDDWRAHLSGQIFIGISPLLDDGKVWFTCMDVDKIGNSQGYDVDFGVEMKKIASSGFPLVVFKTKSGGLRPIIFFSEPVEAELARRKMSAMAAQLGYGGCEVFPKQDKIVVTNGEKMDFPSWIFIPFGPAPSNMDMPEQCCLDDVGNAMDMYQATVYAMRMRISRERFVSLLVEEEKAKTNGKTNGKKHPKGRWQQEATWIETIEATFWDGPICLWHIAMNKSRDNQHYFLLNCASFLQRKYPENWDEALIWVNMSVLSPTGSPEKLTELIKSLKQRKDNRYDYTCKQEPICSHCHAKACRKQSFGVGSGDGQMDHWEWGLTIINRNPRIFIMNVEDTRVAFDADDMMSQHRFNTRCLSYGIPLSPIMKKNDWQNLLSKNIEEATIVEPTEIMRTDAVEIELLQQWFSRHVINLVRSLGQTYLNGGGNNDDAVRVRVQEKKFYFKWIPLQRVIRNSFGEKDAERLRRYLDSQCEYHDKRVGSGARGWYRCTWSIGFDRFDEHTLNRWLDPDSIDREEDPEDDELDPVENESPEPR